jgi:hypothetical protein
MDRLLWNGEYYIQLLDDVDEYRHQYGDGCLSDQLFGQLQAHVVGLGYVLPTEHVRQALAAVHRHNFRPSLQGHQCLARTYALEDESGLVLCSWPNGGRPRHPFHYCDEVWTGVEYQVAAHLIYEGLIDEGLQIVRAVRRRQDGYRRNPWNEVEAGQHYARSLASWALLLAYTGFHYDATRNAISFAPANRAAPLDITSFFSTGNGWGAFCQNERSFELALKYGTLTLCELRLALPESSKPRLTHAGRAISSTTAHSGETVAIHFEPLTLAAGDVLRADFS